MRSRYIVACVPAFVSAFVIVLTAGIYNTFAGTVNTPGFTENSVEHKPVQVGFPHPDPMVPRPMATGWENTKRNFTWNVNGAPQTFGQLCHAEVYLDHLDATGNVPMWVYRKDILYMDYGWDHSNTWDDKMKKKTIGWLRLPVVDVLGEPTSLTASRALLVTGGYDWQENL